MNNDNIYPNILWIDLTIYGSKLEQYSLLELYARLHVVTWPIPELTDGLPIDAIVVEFDYPAKEQLGFLTEIKSKHPSFPLIMLTEQRSEELAVWALRARVWDYFTKPLAQDRFISCIQSIAQMKLQSGRQEKRKPIAPVNSKPIDTRFHNVNKDYRAITPALTFLESNYQKKISEKMLASLCGMSPFRFSRSFKKAMDITFQEYLVRLRIKESLRHLQNPNASITDVAMLVGFNDTSYFSKTFKKYMQRTPSEYRLTQNQSVDSGENQQLSKATLSFTGFFMNGKMGVVN